jgi:two-component system nitrogen regulation response regulator NtrX
MMKHRPLIGSSKSSILVVDNDAHIRRELVDILAHEGYHCIEARDGIEALERISSNQIDLIFLDVFIPRMNGLEVLEKSIADHPEIPVIMISGQSGIREAVAATKKGAFDFIEKPLDAQRILIAARNALSSRRLLQERNKLLHAARERYKMIGTHPKMQEVYNLIERASQVDSKVLITGEPGTGKELVARAIHWNSDRATGPFVALNCSAIPETLIESEMFGHEKGAFTGASSTRVGRFERANGGTLFLDEIGDMSLMMQAKVLRVIEDGVIERVGGNRSIRVNARIIAATNKNLRKEVESGNFRSDLYFRLNVIHISLPPLRERREDIRLLAESFLEEICTTQGLPEKSFSANVWPILEEYSWPGNVRELRNVVERAAILSPEPVIDAPTVQECLSTSEPSLHPYDTVKTLREARREFEREYILTVLKNKEWNIVEAAQALGMDRTNLYRKLREYNIQIPK